MLLETYNNFKQTLRNRIPWQEICKATLHSAANFQRAQASFAVRPSSQNQLVYPWEQRADLFQDLSCCKRGFSCVQITSQHQVTLEPSSSGKPASLPLPLRKQLLLLREMRHSEVERESTCFISFKRNTVACTKADKVDIQ